MVRRMLIDATHPEETRVAIITGNRLDDFDFESASKKQLKGNIYLAKVTRVEPSLQAAFVDYGGNRHGFLAFGEIHPDYYRIPVADRDDLEQEDAPDDDVDDDGELADIDDRRVPADGDDVEILGGDEMEEIDEILPATPQPERRYKIQEVIKKRQILLIQVTKEERGTKGAALTTYLSLAGRYCVLMPNTPRGGGISRKVTGATDRKRLKKIMEDLKVPDGLAVILRTAGVSRSKAEIKRDYEYLVRLWNDIRGRTLESTAPALIYEEGNLIKRAIRDLYTNDIEEVLIDGEDGYKAAKDFMKMLIPSHAKRVKRYKDDTMPLFHRYQVEGQIDNIHSPVVRLRSGGYIVIDSTEALVAIDVNSGRSTRERNIEETAYKTNLEAAEEVARQLRLRDLAGLIVVDFIDMDEARNNAAVEKRFKEAVRTDRARIQVGRISPFGLLELSRQRLRPSLFEASTERCPTCGGTGAVRSTESTSLHVLRHIEEEGIRGRYRAIEVHVPTSAAFYILNNKRHALAEMEQRYGLTVRMAADDTLIAPEMRVEELRGEAAPASPAAGTAPSTAAETDDQEKEAVREGGRKRGRSRRRKPKGSEVEVEAEAEASAQAGAAEKPQPDDEAAEEDHEGGRRRPRRRGKRGGRRRSRRGATHEEAMATGDETAGVPEAPEAESERGAGVETPAAEGSSTAETGDAHTLEVAAEASAAAGQKGEKDPPRGKGGKTGPARRGRARRPTRKKAANGSRQGEDATPAAAGNGDAGKESAPATGSEGAESTTAEGSETDDRTRKGWWRNLVE